MSKTTEIKSTNANASETKTAAEIVADLIGDREGFGPARIESLEIAVALGADEKTLVVLRDASRLCRNDTIILPAHRYESLSRGRGWARKGSGSSAVWGERADKGYRVSAGRWVVGATDGFSRKASDVWTVKHVRVGEATWTIAD
jgi:hypothetical protein